MRQSCSLEFVLAGLALSDVQAARTRGPSVTGQGAGSCAPRRCVRDSTQPPSPSLCDPHSSHPPEPHACWASSLATSQLWSCPLYAWAHLPLSLAAPSDLGAHCTPSTPPLPPPFQGLHGTYHLCSDYGIWERVRAGAGTCSSLLITLLVPVDNGW